MKPKIWNVLQWLTAIFLGILTVGTIGTPPHIGALFLAISTVIVAPSSRKGIYQAAGVRLSGGKSLTIAIVCFLVAFVFIDAPPRTEQANINHTVSTEVEASPREAADPVVTQVSESGEAMKIEGFSESDSQVVMTYEGEELQRVSTNRDGYFVFEKVDKRAHFMKITIINVAKNNLQKTTFIDTTAYTLNDELPKWINRVAVEESIGFTTRETNDDSLPQGQTRVAQEGREGKKVIYYIVTYIGADEITRSVDEEVVESQPVEQVIARGTYRAPAAQPATPRAVPSAYYKNCAAARAAGVAPLYRGDPGYGSHLDRDGDGVACER